MSITEHILAHPGEKFDVDPFVDKHCKHPIEEIQAAIDGSICDEQADKLRIILNHIGQLQAHLHSLESQILRLAEPLEPMSRLLRTVPGLSADPMTSIGVIAEIGADMSVFPTAKHLAS